MTESKRFKVISIYTNCECNKMPRCKGCYVNHLTDKDKRKPDEFWYDLVPYLKEITNQIAFSCFEATMFPDFVIKFTKLCKDNRIIANITSNGILIRKVPKEFYDNITMVSLSLDENKQGIESNENRIVFGDEDMKLR